MIMKRFSITIVAAFVSVSLFAQKGDIAIGGNVSYGTEIENVGFGAKGQYNFTDAIRGEVSFDYFLKKNYVSMWDINFNAHYLFPITEKIKVYPLAGFTFTNWSVSYSEAFISISGTESRFGANLGGGFQYDVSDNFILNAEVKYQLISDFDQAVFSIGAAYRF